MISWIANARHITIPSIMTQLDRLMNVVDISKRSLQYTRLVLESYHEGLRSPAAMRAYALLGGSILLTTYQLSTAPSSASLPGKVMAYAKAFLQESKKVFDAYSWLNAARKIYEKPRIYLLPFAFAAAAYYYRS